MTDNIVDFEGHQNARSGVRSGEATRPHRLATAPGYELPAAPYCLGRDVQREIELEEEIADLRDVIADQAVEIVGLRRAMSRVG